MTSDNKCFPSLLSLRVTHSELLKRHQVQGNDAGTLQTIESFIHRGKATGALLDNEEERYAAQGFLDYWSAILYRAGQEPPEATLHDFDPNLAPMPDSKQCPYIGLRAYQETDQTLLHGRESLIRQMLQKVESERLLTVIGTSGSGKTSVVLGGLIPQLKARALPDSQNWLNYSLVSPGDQPLEKLAQLICPDVADQDKWVSQFIQKLKQDVSYLTTCINRLGKDKPAVFVVDQLEQIFTLCQDSTTRQIFINSLLHLSQASEPRHIVVFIVQSGYATKLASIPGFEPFLRQSQIHLTSPSVDELWSMITRPADLVGLKFEEGVVDAIVQDTRRESDCLSLLQFILTSLWEKRDRNRITWQHYREIGRGRQAIIQSADQCLESLSPEEAAIAQQILLSLVQMGNGPHLVKRRISLETINGILEPSQIQNMPGGKGTAPVAGLANMAITDTSGKIGQDTEQPAINTLYSAETQAQGLISERLKAEFDNRPPLFPWETKLEGYLTELPNQSTQPRLTNLRLDKFSSLLPERVLTSLLSRCQEISHTAQKQGVKLVKALETLFPDNVDSLEPIANMVLTPAYRSGVDTDSLAELSYSYEEANPQQQIVISMLAAKEIFDLLTLVVSREQPIAERQWQTSQGELYLKIVLMEPNGLHIRGQLPCDGMFRVRHDGLNMQAQRDSPGLLSMELTDLQLDQAYPLEVKLSEQDETPLRFNIGILSNQN